MKTNDCPRMDVSKLGSILSSARQGSEPELDFVTNELSDVVEHRPEAGKIVEDFLAKSEDNLDHMLFVSCARFVVQASGCRTTRLTYLTKLLRRYPSVTTILFALDCADMFDLQGQEVLATEILCAKRALGPVKRFLIGLDGRMPVGKCDLHRKKG